MVCIGKNKCRDVNTTLGQIGSTFKRLYPDRAFNYHFLDETFEKQYAAEKRLSSVFGYFSIFIVFISCLGLFGLVSIAVEQNKKAIGIRKVLGASVTDVVFLFSKNYLIWIGIAAAITFPFAYLLMSAWLESFAYRINIAWWMFALSLGITIAGAILTISYKIIKVALENPVESLRYE